MKMRITLDNPVTTSIYDFILENTDSRAGVSTRDIQEACGISSVSVVQRHLEALEQLGKVERPRLDSGRAINRGLSAVNGSEDGTLRITLRGEAAARARGLSPSELEQLICAGA